MKKKVNAKVLVVGADASPIELIKTAVTSGADVEKLGKLIELKERWDANEARKAYHQAMTAFKANPPKILKDKLVSFGQGKANYKHATLANVTSLINTELSKHGLSASWQTKQNGNVVVTCKITHILGHSEETTLSAPADDSGSKNKIQAIGSAITYLERYTLLALTGLAAFDQDDDSQATEKQADVISNEQLSTIRDYLAELNISEKGILKFAKIEKLEDLPKSKYKEAIDPLKARHAEKLQKNKEGKK